jgi:hypothetical protein
MECISPKARTMSSFWPYSICIANRICGRVGTNEETRLCSTRVSDFVRGKWDKFSLDMLITLEVPIGRKVLPLGVKCTAAPLLSPSDQRPALIANKPYRL